jgi:4-hydroxybenzoate polyprenyltransferase
MQKVVIAPVLQTFGFDNSLDNMLLALLIIASVLIAAGGYVINDYFDVKIDAINHPEKQIIGLKISRKNAMKMHQILTGLGIISGFALAFLVKSFSLGFIFIVAPGLLWFYSASYKRQFIIGNLVVAFLAAISILVPEITQMASLEKEFGKLIFQTPIPQQMNAWVGGFAVFSFLCTWIREIIKDMEDEKGDREMECRTLPIKWGIKNTKLFLYGLILITVSGLFLATVFFIPFDGTLTIRYIIFGLALPFAALVYFIFSAKTPAEFHQASSFLKVIMLIGMFYSFVFYYLQAKTFGISIFNLFIVR